MKRRGVTLLEMLVAMAVLGTLMTAAITIFVPPLHRFETADSIFDAQRAALDVMRQLSADLRESSASLVFTRTATAGGTGQLYVAIATARDAGGAFHALTTELSPPMPDDAPVGGPQWRGWIEYWPVADPTLPGTCRLLRRVRYVGSFRPPTGAYDFSALGASTAGKLVASGVSSLSVQTAGYSVGQGRIWIQVKTERSLHDRITSFEGDKSIEMLD